MACSSDLHRALNADSNTDTYLVKDWQPGELSHETDAADAPYGPALFSLAMRIGTLGKQFSAPELRGALQSVGFVDAVVQNTHGYFSPMSARKP